MRAFWLTATVPTKIKAWFAQTCTCNRCLAWRERQARCLIHRRANCIECQLGRNISEIYWIARAFLVGKVTRVLGIKSSVKRFALICPCWRCDSWRARVKPE